jgi:hypothetical protein
LSAFAFFGFFVSTFFATILPNSVDWTVALRDFDCVDADALLIGVLL